MKLDDTPQPLGGANGEIVMVPVPRSQLPAVDAVLGRRPDGATVPWEAWVRGALGNSGLVAKEVFVPAARSLNGEDLAETVGSAVCRSVHALLEGLDPPDQGSRDQDS